MKLSFRCHPYFLTINFNSKYIYNFHRSIFQKAERSIEIRQRFHALTLKIVRPRFDYIAYNIQVYICSATRLIVINQLQQEARERCKIIELRISAHAMVALPGRTRSSPLPSRVPLLRLLSFAPRDASSSRKPRSSMLIDRHVRAIIVFT